MAMLNDQTRVRGNRKLCGPSIVLSLVAGAWMGRRWSRTSNQAVTGCNEEKQQMNEQIRVGFPEFQNRVVKEFPRFLAALPALQAALNELTGAAHDALTPERHLILNLGILAGTSMMETILMGINGFGPGAMKAVRSLLEASVTAEYIRLNPEAYEDFFEFGHVERFKELEFVREYLPESYAELLEEGIVQDITAEMNRVESRFGKRQT
jgi:hypothetical protein